MPITKVSSNWVSGNLVFYDASGNEIFTVDGANRKLSIPSGSAFDLAGTQAFTGTQTFDDIAGNDSSLGITGLAATAATGGAVVVTGGATTTSGVGGAVSLTGGAGSGTSAGGAASLVGGASGAGATGNGGAVSVTGGAAASTNGTGGAITAAGGVATGTGTGGAISLTGGASAGASGTGGDVSLASGAAAGGTEGSVNVQTVATGKLGFFNVTPIARASAYTQTYSTADKTHANSTFTNLSTTAATQTTPWGFATQAQGDEVATKVNALGVDVADLKQLVNSILDDLQSYGLLQ